MKISEAEVPIDNNVHKKGDFQYIWTDVVLTPSAQKDKHLTNVLSSPE